MPTNEDGLIRQNLDNQQNRNNVNDPDGDGFQEIITWVQSDENVGEKSAQDEECI